MGRCCSAVFGVERGAWHGVGMARPDGFVGNKINELSFSAKFVFSVNCAVAFVVAPCFEADGTLVAKHGVPACTTDEGTTIWRCL